MQTSVHHLPGQGFLKSLAKIFMPFTLLAIFFLLVRHDAKLSSSKTKQTTVSKDLSPVVNKMFAATYFDKKRKAHSLIGETDTNRLKQSDWFKNVKLDIEKRTYQMVADKEAKAFGSANHAQNLKANYRPEQFSLQPLSVDAQTKHAKDWQLNIVVNGLYADDKLLVNPHDANSKASTDQNDAEYHFGNGLTIQYHNDENGVRQNFIIKEKPVGQVKELRVSMHAEGDWVVDKVHNTEIHFAKTKGRDVLENKVTYNGLKAWDANGKALLAKMEVKNNQHFEIITEVADAVYPVTIDPLSTSASTSLNGSGNFGWSVASAGDVNGDGYSDVIVGDDGGHAYIYAGSASGLSSSIATTLSGPATYFGISVASAGDVDGDGYSDVIVGDGIGNAYVYYGAVGGLNSNPLKTQTIISGLDPLLGGAVVAGAGDVNGDGYSDIMVSSGASTQNVLIYYGASTGLSTASHSTLHEAITGGGAYGWSIASAGDVNADGNSDVIVGDKNGNAYLYLGVSSGTINTMAAIKLSPGAAGFGFSVASAGDVNGDGYSDVIVGDGAGNAYVYYGQTGLVGLVTPAATTLNVSGNTTLGNSVASAGDVNGDAFADVIVGDDKGHAYVFTGSASGLSASPIVLTGTNNYGISVACAGDVNGDGYSDVIVGSSNTSSAFTYQGGPSGSALNNTISITSGSSGDRYGLSVASAGDINGDGYSDVIVGAIGYNGLPIGGAFIYMGGPNGLNTGSSVTLTPGGPEVGWCVSGAGDINGDGYDDIMIGAKFAPSYNNSGQVFIYLGHPGGIVSGSAPDATLQGANNYDLFGESLSSAGDVNGDGYGDIIIGAPGVGYPIANNTAGAAYIYLGGALGISSTATPATTLYGPAANAAFGASVANAGDVNGDGYGDVIVGAPNLGAAYDLEDYGNANTGTPAQGKAYVFYGTSTGIANGATPNATLSDASLVDFGISVASAGDVNGDGFSDVIVGASSGDNTANQGSAELFLGAATGLSTSPSATLNGLTAGDQFGATVASAGDVNGDGYSDVIIRATMAAATSGTGTKTGTAYIFLGSPNTSGLTTTSTSSAMTISDEGSDTYLEQPGYAAALTIMHRCVGSAGDVNGDGYSDVIVGVYVDASKTGKTYLYYGNNANGRNASNVLKLYQSDFSGPLNASNVPAANFGLGLSTQSPFGTVKGQMVWETEANGKPFSSSTVPSITNSVSYSAISTAAQIAPGGYEFRGVVDKRLSVLTKVRARIKYASTAVTFGQVYGPWVYSQTYLSSGSSGALPMKLLKFTATVSGQDILLNWQTSDEVNMWGYVIEHSLDGKNFDSIGVVAAKGSQNVNDYEFTHYNPGPGKHYYRLREVDLDKNAILSKDVWAIINNSIELKIYPNPTTDHIVISCTGFTATYARIINSAGAVMGQYKLDPSGKTTISLSGFAKGSYFVELINSGFPPSQISIQ